MSTTVKFPDFHFKLQEFCDNVIDFSGGADVVVLAGLRSEQLINAGVTNRLKLDGFVSASQAVYWKPAAGSIEPFHLSRVVKLQSSYKWESPGRVDTAYEKRQQFCRWWSLNFRRTDSNLFRILQVELGRHRLLFFRSFQRYCNLSTTALLKSLFKTGVGKERKCGTRVAK